MPHSNNLCYDFDLFRFDVDQRVLTRAGKGVSLTPKATDILILLLRNAGQIVDKEVLLKAVWPNTFVEEANVTQNIFTLRRALGDARVGPRYIETVPRRGYRFIAEVKPCTEKEPRRDSDRFDATDDGVLFQSPPRLAVLPFLNATGDENLEYLAEGVTDSLTNNLSRTDKLRIVSRSGAFRYRGSELDPQQVGKALGVDAVLSGKIQTRPNGMGVSAELVEVDNGWQLWGASFDLAVKDILEVQDEIARQISSSLRLKLTGEEEKKITTRYTENSEAYQAYLEGRYHWSKYTKPGIEKAIGHFALAIELDPNYALAYSGIVDCYLRLATNYLPPQDALARADIAHNDVQQTRDEIYHQNDKVELRHEWDWKGAQRELRRANELNSSYPAAHLWYAAYVMVQQLCLENGRIEAIGFPDLGAKGVKADRAAHPRQIRYFELTPSEQVQILCTIAREQIEVGNFEAAEAVLRKWWSIGQWPVITGLNAPSSADLLFTVGMLAGCLASSKQLSYGQKHCEALLNGSLGMYQQQGSGYCTSEVRLELATCYYRQGLFDLARRTIKSALAALKPIHRDLIGMGLVRLGIIERHAGQLQRAYDVLTRSGEFAVDAGPWVSSRYNQELATTLRDLAIAESRDDYFEEAIIRFRRALYEFDAVGNHRYSAVVENNYGYLLLCLNEFEEAEGHLKRSRDRFAQLDDRVRRAQVDDTLAQLYLATNRLTEAELSADCSIETLEAGDEEALLAESLNTKALVRCRQGRLNEAKGLLEGANRLAMHCGDLERVSKTLVTIVEEMVEHLDSNELSEFELRLSKLPALSLQGSTQGRIEACIKLIARRKSTWSPTPRLEI